LPLASEVDVVAVYLLLFEVFVINTFFYEDDNNINYDIDKKTVL